jgi:hypothetical protein
LMEGEIEPRMDTDGHGWTRMTRGVEVLKGGAELVKKLV